jgi:hypothetical protein
MFFFEYSLDLEVITVEVGLSTGIARPQMVDKG